jgi:Xaa-Pro aminopeptidase
MEYASLRQPEVWARDDISFLDESLVYAYASPTDRSTGLIGDIGVTLYRGSNNSVREHLSTCLEISVKVAQFVQVGMELREAFHFAEKLISEARLTNQTSSVTDLGALNVGHTVPFTFDSYPNEARRCLADETAMGIADLISRQRVFINSSSSLRIQPNMAFTIEPRMASELMPLSSFHLIVAFLDGQKSVLSSFQPVFDVFGMVEYLPTDLLAALEEMSREDGGLVC